MGRLFGDPLWVEIVVGNPLPTVQIPVLNETGGTLYLRLTGPATYNFTLATGTQYITVVSGQYNYVGQGCGGASKSGEMDLTDDAEDWRWWCS